MKISHPGLTLICTSVALCSAFYLPKTKRPFDLVGVKFCPKTANIHQINADKYQHFDIEQKATQYKGRDPKVRHLELYRKNHQEDTTWQTNCSHSLA